MISTARMLLALALLRVADWVAGDGALLPKAETATTPESDDDGWHPVIGVHGRVIGRARPYRSRDAAPDPDGLTGDTGIDIDADGRVVDLTALRNRSIC